MNVLHVIPRLSREGGGPSRSCQGLVVALSNKGVTTSLLSLYKGDEPWVDGVSDYMNAVPFEAAISKSSPDIVHLHEIWNLGLHKCAGICRRMHIPYVVSPRGMLEPWSLSQKWLKKRIARFVYQDRDLRFAAALHATAESEAEQFRKLGFKNPIIVSPNGVNVPNCDLATKNTKDAKRVLFVSRMHPKKGVMELVEAWNTIKHQTLNIKHQTWMCELVYTVNGDFEREYEAKVKARVKELGLEDQFIFTGALNDDEKWQAYAMADLFVLPTYSENFGIVVAEALWAGVPVITTKGTPWKELEERKCGWWIDTGVEPLAEVLKKSLAVSRQSLAEMGERGRKLVEEKYTWDAVVATLLNGYKEIIDEIAC